MNESKRYREPRRLERATYSRQQIEASVDRLVELRLAERFEDIAYAVDQLPAALTTPVVLALIHRAAGVQR